MSEGPIAKERAAWKAPIVSTSDSGRVCMRAKGRGYCGRTSSKTLAVAWAKVTCADCRAAARADGKEIS